MDCIDLFKRAAWPCRLTPVTWHWMQARKANDNDEELQNLIGEFNLAKRMDLNNEIGKSERGYRPYRRAEREGQRPVRPDHGR